MPEYPEVCTVAKELKKNIINKEVDNINVVFSKLLRNISVDEFQKKLKHQKVFDVNNYGKYLIIHFTDYDLLIHLRMEGKLFYYDQPKPLGKHDHIVFNFTDKSVLIYNDVRKFGTFDLFEKGEYKDYKGVAKLGKEPFDKSLDGKYLLEKLNNNKNIKQNLLDQTIINGLGNIYVDEILFASKINPKSISKDLTLKDTNNIVKNMQSILKKAIDHNGTTIKSFSASDQIKGGYQDFLKVYKRENEECFICKTKIQKIKVGGRGTHFCPYCQKLK